MTIGEVIKNKRNELGMTQEYIAKTVGTTKATVSRWESGDIGKMKEPMIKAIANTLQLDEWLFVQPHEVLTRDEEKLLASYRKADEGTRSAVKKLLDIIN